MILTKVKVNAIYELIQGYKMNEKNKTNFEWLEKNILFTDVKSRVLDITITNIEQNTENINKIINKAEGKLKLLSKKYTKLDLDFYYDVQLLIYLEEDNSKV